eukprot:m.126839 g.126839  ORF g.126839 m.126839 type:complete len:77 (+) comp17391_c0_seq6:512-742(+)
MVAMTTDVVVMTTDAVAMTTDEVAMTTDAVATMTDVGTSGWLCAALHVPWDLWEELSDITTVLNCSPLPVELPCCH